MRKLGDQWIEVIDGREHMVKVGLSMKGEACRGCIYMGRVDECSHPCGCPMKNQFDPTTIVKDLGILNEDGLLPCPFCGEYPVVENAYEGFGYTPPDGYWRVYCSNDNHEISMSSGKRRQESIKAWNRRQ